VNPREAAIVQRIFELYAAGSGYRSIADILNLEGLTAPPPRAPGRPQAWAASTIREILHRPLYRGEVVWNQRQKRNSWGQKRYAERPEQQWIRLQAPELRIVSEALWQGVQERLRNAQAIYLRSTNGRLWGRPANGIQSKYLLTGLLQCGLCGGPLTVTSSDWRTRRRFAYACSHNRFRGRSVCANNLWAPMDLADRVVLGAFKDEVLHPRVVERTITKALAQLREPEEPAEETRARLNAELTRVELELSRLTEAIVAGGDVNTLVSAMKERERRRVNVKVELEALDRTMCAPGLDPQDLMSEIHGVLTDWQGLLAGQPIQARQILRKLIEGRLVFTPGQDGRGRFYEVAGQATLGPVLAGTFLAKAMVTPAGFEPAISTLKGSRPGPG
jgi:site-specific DNA recombinase